MLVESSFSTLQIQLIRNNVQNLSFSQGKPKNRPQSHHNHLIPISIFRMRYNISVIFVFCVRNFIKNEKRKAQMKIHGFCNIRHHLMLRPDVLRN